MFDAALRQRLAGPLDRVARLLDRAGVSPTMATVAGLVLAMGAAVAAGRASWTLAAVLWVASRGMDTLDGPLARRQGRASEFGGLLDIIADFTSYGAFVVGCAIGAPDARVACLVLLAAYYVNGSTFLAFSSMVERQGRDNELADDRSLVFLRGLTEGAETVVVHTLMAVFPAHLATIAWVFAGAVGVTIAQRLVTAARVLRS